MKVSSAMHVFSQSTCAAVKYLVKEEQRPVEYLTTAWFLKTIDRRMPSTYSATSKWGEKETGNQSRPD